MIEAVLQQALDSGIQHFVAGGFVIRNNQILLIRRATHEDFLPGYFEIPSGGVDQGETVEQGLLREVKEETNLDVRLSRYLNHFDYIGGRGNAIRQFNFLVEPLSDTVQLNPDEHDAYEWVALSHETLDGYQISSKTKDAILGYLAGV